MHLSINTSEHCLSVGAKIAHSDDTRLLRDVVHLYASHTAYNIEVTTYPQPHVMLPVPSPAVLLLLHSKVTLDVPLIDACVRIKMHDVVMGSHIDFYTTPAKVSVITADVLFDW